MSDRTRGALSRQRILAAGVDLVDQHGARALSMRNLGRELGVEAMSLYHYIANREDLLDGLTEVMVGSGLPVASDDQPWDEALRAFAVGIRRTGLAHPAAFQLVGLRPLRNEAALAGVIALLRRLHTSGFSHDDAVAIYRLAAAYARGFVLAEIAGLTLAKPDRLIAEPATSSLLRPFARPLSAEPSATFLDGLEIIVQGAASRRVAAGSAH